MLLPVTTVTSSKEQRDIVRGDDLGANRRVREPVDFEQFAEAIRQLSLYRLILNEKRPCKCRERRITLGITLRRTRE